MIDNQSEPGAWAAELERMGERAPGARPAERTVIESLFRARRADPRFRLEQGDIRLTRADQRMLVEMVRALEDAVTGAPTAKERAQIELLCKGVSDVHRTVQAIGVEHAGHEARSSATSRAATEGWVSSAPGDACRRRVAVGFSPGHGRVDASCA